MSLEPEERERYDYLKLVFEEEFEEQPDFHVSGILVYELLNLLNACACLFDEFGFPRARTAPLRYAITGTIADYLEGD